MNHKTLFSKLKIKKKKTELAHDSVGIDTLPQPGELEELPGTHRRCKERSNSTNSDLRACSVTQKPLHPHSITTTIINIKTLFIISLALAD